MRTALVNRPTIRVDAAVPLGPLPSEGSVVETVRRDRRSVVIEWDDGIVLETCLHWSGEWHLYRSHETWRRPMAQARAVVEVPGWIAVCFGSVSVETYRSPDRHRHPQSGGIGPDIRRSDLDIARVVSRLMDRSDPESQVVDVLGDPHLMIGVGNVSRSEILWSLELSPFTRTGDLGYDDCWALVESARDVASRGGTPSVYGRVGQQCHRCHSSIRLDHLGPDGRAVYWCSECQHESNDRLVAPRNADNRDAHPAEVLYLNEARAARERLRIFDDLRELG